MIQNECPICQTNNCTVFLERKNVPVHQNLLMLDQAAALSTSRGTLTLAFCNNCGFIYNQSFDPYKLSYGDYYDNSQTYSPYFEEYIDNLIEYLIVEKNVKSCNIVEVGCGKGEFIKKLVEANNSGNTGYGFDPSYSGELEILNGRLKFEKRYYDASCANIAADVVVSRHVIEHVQKPLDLLKAIRQALVNSPHAKVFIETPCVEWIMQNMVIWDFFYEHCSYFTAQSLALALELSGFEVIQVRNIFGDQYLWLEAKIAHNSPPIVPNPGKVPLLAKHFGSAELELRKSLEQQITTLLIKTPGKVALWGAGAKGATLVNLIDPKGSLIKCIVDLNPQKQGRYIPGTGHSIIAFQELPANDVTKAILMNPNYYRENLLLLQEAHIDSVQLINLA